MAERSSLSFFRALCTRFEVEAAGGDCDFGPIEIWLPHGRIRWDRALSAIEYRHLRLVIHENPGLFVTFARQSPRDLDDDMLRSEYESFAAYPEPAQDGRRTPQLPEQMIAPRSLRTIWTCTSPLAHGHDEKSGNVTMFRRHRAVNALTGEHVLVPMFSGNGVRGIFRRLSNGRALSLIGLKATDIPPERAHSLMSGGSVPKGSDTGVVRNDIRSRARSLWPVWDLFAGCTDGQIMGGRARIHDAVLVCRENAWQVHQAMGIATKDLREWAETLPEADTLTQLRLLTRHDERDLARTERMERDGKSDQMLVNTEVVLAGSQFLHSLQIFSVDGVDPVTASCLADLLEDFRLSGTVGAQSARGMGQIAFDPYQPGPGTPELPDPTIYLDYVEKHKAEMVDWAMMRGEPDAPAPRGKGPKGRGKQAATEVPEEERQAAEETF